jgi:uncharacterized membrane protein
MAAMPTRHAAIDAVRGLVMVVMALDHVRDFVHADAMIFQPEDLARTNTALFLTRWITHICAPAFVFLAGIAAYRKLRRDGSASRLSWYLATRGMWLVLVELTLVRFAMNFRLMGDPWLLLVLFALGLSMVALAALVHLPRVVLGITALALIVLHNLLDPIRAADLGWLSPLWLVLHQQGAFTLMGYVIVVAYPVLPWIGVMAAGFWAGGLFDLEAGRRRRTLLWTGSALIVGFLILRAWNVYGDPQPWSAQATTTMTVLSFLRTTKYPPSLAFLLMTLGPVLLALAWFEKRSTGSDKPLAVIGRVPLFYYVVHFLVAHVVASTLAWMRWGDFPLMFLSGPFPSMGGSREAFPPDFGWPLWVVYLVWIGVVLLMYPLCRAYGRVKQERRWPWLAYL